MGGRIQCEQNRLCDIFRAKFCNAGLAKGVHTLGIAGGCLKKAG